MIDDYQILAQTQAFAMLTMDGSSLLVPQGQIISLEPVMDLRQSPSGQGSLGTMRFQGRSVPIFRLNDALEKQQSLDAEHRFCVIFDCRGTYFGLLCRQMQPVNRDQLILAPIPVCMRQADMVFRALAIREKAVIKLTNTLALALYLGIVKGESDG